MHSLLMNLQRLKAEAGFVTVALSGHNTAWRNSGSASSTNNAICASSSPDYCPDDCTQSQCSTESDGQCVLCVCVRA